MRIQRATFTGLTLAVALCLATPLMAQLGGSTVAPPSGPSVNTIYLPNPGLSHLATHEIQGDYVAAGVGMRNVGGGDISLSIPAGASLYKAYLFWGIIWNQTPPASTGDLNSTTITGTLAGTAGSPCWGGSGINFYYADVTGVAVSGVNTLDNFPSGLTNNAPPQGNIVFPLLNGATLVLVYMHPLWDFNTVSIFTGATTFANQTVMNNVGSFTAWTAGNAADQVAQHTYIMADGQARFAGGSTAFNMTATSGPGTGIKTADSFNGADGIVTVDPNDGLWDTHTIDVSSFFPNGAATTAEATAGALSDCISWGAHVISVKTKVNAFIDVKPGSCPNSFNVMNRGVLPVAILGGPGFDVSNIDPSTVKLNGVPRTGNTSISDVSMPFAQFQSGCMDCNLGGQDMYNDLVVRFNSQAVAATLGSVSFNDCVPVTITGNFYDGTPFEGVDILRIVGNIPKDGPSGVAAFDLHLDQNSPNPFVDGTTFSFSIPEESFVTLSVYNALGQKVATVLQGMQQGGLHNVSWNGLNDQGARVAPGVYLYRLETGVQSISKKLIVTN
jgi:hypothetical protein